MRLRSSPLLQAAKLLNVLLGRAPAKKRPGRAVRYNLFRAKKAQKRIFATVPHAKKICI